MSRETVDLSDPYVVEFYKRERERQIRNIVLACIIGLAVLGSFIAWLYVEHEIMLLAIVAFLPILLFAAGTVITIASGVRSKEIPISHILYALLVGLVLAGFAHTAREERDRVWWAGYGTGYEAGYEESYNEWHEEVLHDGWKQGYNDCMADYGIE